ncbi:MAG: PIN domain-containing protein [Archaeoglobi archaeon]|nr:PIN domain-containing protein [Candidatus Mnemosynella bozhongmuii]
MDVFLDTSFIIPLILRTEKTLEARKFFESSEYRLFSCAAVFQETFYVGLRLLAEERFGIKNSFSLRKWIRNNGYNGFEDFLEYLTIVFREINLLEDLTDEEEILSIARKYSLLPNDALIAATCRYYGIRRIATFDEDFKRVDFLDVLIL